MSELELPIVDRDRGIIVKSVNVDSYCAGTGWYVHIIPDKDDKRYGRWRQSDKIAKWCDEELVKLPEDKIPDEPDQEYVLGVLEEMLLENGLSGCERCEKCVPVGELTTKDGSYVATICDECAGNCTQCGEDDWNQLDKKRAHDARETPKKECENCGHVTAAGVSTA